MKSTKNLHLVLGVACAMLVTFATFTISLGQEAASPDVPWWKQQKIRFMWGQWFVHKKSSPIPADKLMEHLAGVGATVFADTDVHGPNVTTFNLEEAKLARQNGIRYFGSAYAWKLAPSNQKQGGRVAVDVDGKVVQQTFGAKCPWPLVCPLQPALYERHIFAPTIEAARTGLVDGLHFDWEAYQASGEPMSCYCDHCFAEFRKHQRVTDDVPAAQRGEWLGKQKLKEKYWRFQNQQRFAMWRGFADRVREVKPDFIFSGYLLAQLAPEAIAEALNAPGAPFIVTDHYFYYPTQSFQWWDSRERYYRNKGYLYVLGTYDNSLFGGQPQAAVSGSQWLYEASLRGDGVWLWFEQEITPTLWQMFGLADQKIRVVESVVGEHLMRGIVDDLPVAAIEWTGDPRLADKTIVRTHHLDDQYLVHVSNVELWQPVTTTLRFPSMPREQTWTVRDPFSHVFFSPDGTGATWTNEDLLRGLTIDMQQRSDRFLQIAPAEPGLRVDRRALVASRTVEPYSPAPEKLSTAAVPPEARANRLLYTASRSMGFGGVEGKSALGNAIYLSNPDGGEVVELAMAKANLRSPQWSPDGRHVAFTYDVNGRGQLFTLALSRSSSDNKSRNDHSDRSPVWSPNGRRLAFASDRDGNWDLYVMNVDSGAVKQLTHTMAANRNPIWSPDGKQLAFETNRDGDWRIYLINADGSNERPLRINWPYNTSILYKETANQLHTAWSPDGKYLALTTTGNWHRAMYVVNMETGVPSTQLLEYYDELADLCWSPDSTTIAGTFISGQLPGKDNRTSGVFTIGVDGKGFNAVVRQAAVQPRPGGGSAADSPSRLSWYSTGAATQPWIFRTFTSLYWSPDGKQLAFSSDMAGDGYFHVHVINRDGSNPVTIEASKSAWSQEVRWQPAIPSTDASAE